MGTEEEMLEEGSKASKGNDGERDEDHIAIKYVTQRESLEAVIDVVGLRLLIRPSFFFSCDCNRCESALVVILFFESRTFLPVQAPLLKMIQVFVMEERDE